MAKTKKGGGKSADPGAAGTASSGAERAAPRPKDLQEAIGVFEKGDYARARGMLIEKANDTALSEGARDEARSMIAATKIERGTLYVGLACIALFALVLIVTSALQP